MAASNGGMRATLTGPSPFPRRERGVALLIVLIVLFVISVLAVDIAVTASTARRSARNASSDFLMDAAIQGGMQVVTAQLLYDLRENAFDSPDDRWARPEFTDVEAKAQSRADAALEAARTGEEPAEAGTTSEGATSLGSTDEVTLKAEITDEESKFNLNLLMHPDPAQRTAARDRFAFLLDRFREGTPLDVSATRAAELRDAVVLYLERAAPVEGDTLRVPLPKAKPWKLLTPDELRNVPGFGEEDEFSPVSGSAMKGSSILYDARDPEAVRKRREDPGAEQPEVYKGLLRYVTLWSGSAWTGAQPDVASWVRINVNTAEKPVLETLFWRNPGDLPLVDRILEYRGAEKDDSKNPPPPSTGTAEPLATHQYFDAIDGPKGLKKVEGLDDAVLLRNGLGPPTVTVVSNTFSVNFLATRSESYRQVRYVVRRHAKGIQTLLREERADPRFDEKAPGESEPAAAPADDTR